MSDDFDTSIEEIITDAKKLGRLEYQDKILTPLNTLDTACATAMNIMHGAKTDENTVNMFGAAWDGLKAIIHEIETGVKQ